MKLKPLLIWIINHSTCVIKNSADAAIAVTAFWQRELNEHVYKWEQNIK